jgi:hypothetical protein
VGASALLIPQTAPRLDYVAVPNPLTLPAGTTMGASRSFGPLATEGLFARTHGLRIDSDGSLWVTDVGAHTARCRSS